MTPLLSIVTITYNHEPYIAKTIEGVLMQQVNFPIELIIAEDCSTDGTRAICQRYAEEYPELIRLITSESNVGAIANERRAMLAARGKYIAFCEGDDYWTDPLKLQKQVDFLEAHPDYSVTFHRCKNYVLNTGLFQVDRFQHLFQNNENGIDIDLEFFFSQWLTQPLTMVYRAESFELDSALQYAYYRDTHLIYHLLKVGKGYLFNFVGAVRQIHNGSMSYSVQEQTSFTGYVIAQELYKKNKENHSKKNYINNCYWYMSDLSQSGKKLAALKMAIIIFTINKSLYKYIKNVKSIIFNKRKS